MRAFVAIEVPEALKEGMAAVQGRLRGSGVDASWSRPEGIHLTLKFLGETSEERVPEIRQALALALSGQERFRLRIEEVGTFPNPASARVVWFGVSDGLERVLALQAAVEQALVGLGLERDGRPYTPHLTLGRIKHICRRGEWLKQLERVKHSRLPEFEVTSVSLIRSELKPSGAVYSELGRVALQEVPVSGT